MGWQPLPSSRLSTARSVGSLEAPGHTALLAAAAPSPALQPRSLELSERLPGRASAQGTPAGTPAGTPLASPSPLGSSRCSSRRHLSFVVPSAAPGGAPPAARVVVHPITPAAAASATSAAASSARRVLSGHRPGLLEGLPAEVLVATLSRMQSMESRHGAGVSRQYSTASSSAGSWRMVSTGGGCAFLSRLAPSPDPSHGRTIIV